MATQSRQALFNQRDVFLRYGMHEIQEIRQLHTHQRYFQSLESEPFEYLSDVLTDLDEHPGMVVAVGAGALQGDGVVVDTELSGKGWDRASIINGMTVRAQTVYEEATYMQYFLEKLELR